MPEEFSPARFARTALPIVAVVALAAVVAANLRFAGDTLGYDFRAYHAAAARVLDGRPLYDLGFEAAGGFGLFYYPPFFAPLVLAFGLLSETTAIWTWIALLLVAFAVGVAILPVSRTVRWWVVLLAAVSWVFAYAVKLGQVGPILFLLFAIGWRWLDSPVRMGISTALGTAIKLQPGILFVWALLTRRFGAVVVGAALLAALAVAATLVAGGASWGDFVRLVGQVADPITTPKNVTPGAIAWQLGASAEVAVAVQWLAMTAVFVALVAAARWATGEASFLVGVVASQLLSPVLWDHYAIVLLLPVAYLCSAGQWWALLLPVLIGGAFLGVGPAALYPICFVVALAGTLAVGIRARTAETAAAA